MKTAEQVDANYEFLIYVFQAAIEQGKIDAFKASEIILCGIPYAPLENDCG